MATLKELEAALVKADAAGNAADAKVFADEIRRMRASQPSGPVVAGPPINPDIQAKREQWRQAHPDQRVGMLLRNFLPYAKEPAKKMAGAVVDAGLEGGGAAVGQALGAGAGPFAPVAVPAGGFVGGAVGNAIGQFRRGGPFSPGKALGAGVAGAIPGGPLAGATARQVVKEGAKQAGGNVAAKATETLVSEGRLPTGTEALASAAAGAIGTAVASKLDKGVKTAGVELKEIQNAVRDRTLREAQAAGYVLPPSRIDPSRVNRLLESIGGKAATAQEAVARNQEITNALAKKELGLPVQAQLTESALRRVRAEAAQPYQEISEMAKKAKADLETLERKSALTAANQHELEVLRADPKYVSKQGELAIKAAADVDALKKARYDAQLYYNSHFKNGRPEDLEKAVAAEALSEELEEKIQIAAQQIGRPDLATRLKESRVRIAKAYEVEKALNLADGNISAPLLGRSLDKGKPLTGGLRTIGQTQQSAPFRSSMRDAATTPTAGVNQLLPFGTAAAAASGAPQGMAAAALFAATGPVRNMVLSQPYQRFMAQPNYGARVPDNLAQFARMSIQADSRNQPNSFLQFLQTEFPKKQ